MRLLCCSAMLLALATAPALANTDIPKRKPGLWEHAMQMDQLPGYTHRAQVCVGENLDDLARHEAAGRCDKTHIVRVDDRVLIESVCQADGSKVTTKGSFSGDFASRYAGQLTSTSPRRSAAWPAPACAWRPNGSAPAAPARRSAT